MGTSNYSDEFKRDAVQQITLRGYPVREVSRRLGVSSHSLYKWLRLFAEPAPSVLLLQPAGWARRGRGHDDHDDNHDNDHDGPSDGHRARRHHRRRIAGHRR